MASRRGRRRQPLFYNEDGVEGGGPVPATHASYHHSGGSDALSLGSIAGTLGNAQVPQGVVTQHQAALAVAFAQLTGSIADGQVPESAVTQHQAAIDHGTIAGLGDDDHSQYHTDGRALTWLGTRNTTDLSEGSNLYWTDARWQTAWGLKTTANLPENTNLYYTDARWQTAWGLKSTTDLSEGTNLYYTNVRADARIALANWEALADVVAYSALADGEISVWNTAAGGWRHRTLAEAGVSATGHVHAAGDITSDTFADALIAESNITQHQAALSIVASQVTAGTFPDAYTFTGLVKFVNHIVKSAASSFLTISGGSTTELGASILLYGESAAGSAKDMRFRSSASTKLWWDDSAAIWTFVGAVNFDLAVTMDTTLDVSGVMRATAAAFAAPAAGASLELNFRTNDDAAHITAFNRTTAAYKTIAFEGASYTFASTGGTVSFSGQSVSMGSLTATTGIFTGLLTTVASASGSAGLNLPHGAAPSSPNNGDVWTTTAGIYVRINGSTVGPLS